MFDIGFAELIIIGVVALLVIGPERLPEAIRTGTAWLNRFRRGFNEIKQEVQQELHNDEIMRGLKESRDQLRDEADALRKGLSSPLSPFEALDDGDRSGLEEREERPTSVDASTGTEKRDGNDTP